jgi:hypothetical protein
VSTIRQLVKLRTAQKQTADLLDRLYSIRETEGAATMPDAVLAQAKRLLATIDGQLRILGTEATMLRMRRD